MKTNSSMSDFLLKNNRCTFYLIVLAVFIMVLFFLNTTNIDNYMNTNPKVFRDHVKMESDRRTSLIITTIISNEADHTKQANDKTVNESHNTKETFGDNSKKNSSIPVPSNIVNIVNQSMTNAPQSINVTQNTEKRCPFILPSSGKNLCKKNTRCGFVWT
jgi:hypothetical protein